MNPSRLISLAAVGVLFAVAGCYAWYADSHVLPHTFIGSVPVGGLTRQQARERLQDAVDRYRDSGIRLEINGAIEVIAPDDFGFEPDMDAAVADAFAHGHADTGMANTWRRVSALWSHRRLEVPVRFDQFELSDQIDQAVAAHEMPRRDIRLVVERTAVHLATDVRPGVAVDRVQAVRAVAHAMAVLDDQSVRLQLNTDMPVADAAQAGQAVPRAIAILSRGLSLRYEDLSFFISRERIGSWITSEYDGDRLVPGLSRAAIVRYVAGIAEKLDVASQPASVTTQDGKVTSFIPPKLGRTVQRDQLVGLVTDALMDRADADKTGDTIVIPMKIAAVTLRGLEAGTGITELIGKAVTTFTGSPKNRISNIKNGVKFISGSLIESGEEFSTLGALGAVDDTTGYLPELVIKGDRTQPEFGGGLCQVSTTLFRAVMNAGLPITARQNHSYRVSYYEKDGNGVKIGPGLDATVYQPKPDLRFRNDMATPVLIIGYVVGDKVTFELYGTKDGRTSMIDGPHLLTEVPAGDPVYIPSPLLPQGQTKQVETPHPGGTAVASYGIIYADGRTDSQVFHSRYRPWPAKFLVGISTDCLTPAECSALHATPTPTP